MNESKEARARAAKTKPVKGNAVYLRALREARKKRPNYPLVIRMLRAAIRQCNPDAAGALASWYYWGKEPHIKKDLKEAIRLSELAAARGNIDSLYNLAVANEKGEGMRVNLKKAFALYLRAAIRGEAQSIMEVGRCLYWGIGTKKDRHAANIWYDRAKELGILS